MASRNIRGITVEIGGNTTGLSRALGDVDAQSRNLRNELRQVERALQLDPSNVELLSQRQDILAESIGSVRERLERLRSVQSQVEQQFQNGDIGIEQYRAFQREIISTENELQDLQGQADATADTTQQLGDTAEQSGEGFTVAKGAIATFIGNGLTALISKTKECITSLLGLADSTREYRDQMAKLDTAAQDNGYSVDYAMQKYNDLYGVLGDETASNTTVSNFMAMGANQETLNSLIDSSIGIWAKYGDSIPLDGLAESVNETAKVGQITGNLADALNWAGINEDAFNEKLATCTDEQDRQRLIAETLSGTYGSLSAKYQETNSSVIDANKANADYTDNMAQMGAKIEPAMTEVKKGINGVITKALELIQNVNFDKVKENIQAAFKTINEKVLPAVKNGLGWIIDHKTELVAGIIAIATAFLAFKVVTIIQAVVAAMQGMTLAQAALNLVMSLNPIGIVVAAIAGLVAAFIVLWNKCDWFRNLWIGLWEKIKAIFFAVVDWIKANWESIILFILNPVAGLFKYFYDNSEGFRNFINGVLSAIGGFFVNLWNGITNTFANVGGWFIARFTEAWNGITSVFSGVGDFFSGIWDTIKEKFTTIGTAIGDAVGGAFKSVINGVLNFVEEKINGFIDNINNAVDVINKIPGVDISKLDHVDLPQLANGGVVSSGQAIFAEAGPEMLNVVNGKAYVTPLTNSARNTALNSVGGGGNTYNITNVVNVKSASTPSEIRRIDTQLATLQKQRIAAVGG